MWARSSRRSVHVAFLRQWVERQLLISWRYGRADGSVEILSELFLISPLRRARTFFEQHGCGIAAAEPFSVLMKCLPQLIFCERLYKMGNGKHAANAYYKLILLKNSMLRYLEPLAFEFPTETSHQLRNFCSCFAVRSVANGYLLTTSINSFPFAHISSPYVLNSAQVRSSRTHRSHHLSLSSAIEPDLNFASCVQKPFRLSCVLEVTSQTPDFD